MTMRRLLIAYFLLTTSPLFAQMSGVRFISSQERTDLNRLFSEKVQRYESMRSNGDIVGNGAGLAELNLAYVYRSIPSFIDRYLNSPNNGLRQNDKKTLLQIKRIVEERTSYSNVFEFVAKEDLSLIFNGEDDRIAMTGFSQEFPIYINKALLYQTPELSTDLPLQASIIIHELGHQTGIKSHKYLDYLGAAVQNYLQKRFSSHELDLGGGLSIKIFNRTADDYTIPQVLLTHLKERAEITRELRSNIVCPDGRQAIAFDMRNAHWERPEDEKTAKFNFWSKLICPYRGTTRSYEKDYSIIISLPSLEIDVIEL